MKIGQRMFREVRLQAGTVDANTRTVEAALSSEQPVERWFGQEVLVHSTKAVNLDRARDGSLPLLFSHDPTRLIGSVTNIRLEDGRLRGTLTFGRSEDAEERWRDVQDGHLRSVSIGYTLDEWVQEKGSDEVKVTRWTLLEASMVSIPADATVGVGRSLEDTGMDHEDLDITTIERETSASTAQQRMQGVKAERQRIRDITARFAPFLERGAKYVSLRDQCIDKGVDAERAGHLLLDMVASSVEPVVQEPPVDQGFSRSYEIGGRSERQTLMQPGNTAFENYRTAAALTIAVRSGLATDKERQQDKGSVTQGMTLVELAREALRVSGQDSRGDPMAVVRRAFMLRTAPGVSHTTSDFVDILVDAANKSALRGYSEAPETWNRWARVGSTNDFRRFHRAGLSGFGDLDVVPEGHEYEYGSMADVREYAQLRTYGKLFSITRQAIVNDDLNQFTKIPMAMGRAAARMVGDEVYNILINGTTATLAQDGVALFNTATHANYVSSGGAAPNVTTLDTGYKSMATQTDPNGVTLNIRPRHLIVPVALEMTSKVLAASQYDPGATAGVFKPNPFAGVFEVTADARLDGFNPAGWFLAADGNQYDTVEAVFLNGQQEPYLEQQDTFTIDGVAFKVRLDVVALALDYRGLYYNDGA